jgi:UDP-N-acetyl-2-amino-2-deoxyglucuronate dehydrogenase
LSPVRFGIIGCGTIAPTHAAALRQLGEAELVAVADVVPERAKALAEKFGVARVYENERALCRDKSVDAVVVATPSGMHAKHAISALRAGKHAIVEKPIDVSLAACDRLIRVQQETGLKVGVISQHRWDHASVFVKDAVAGGRLGKIFLVEASIKWWRSQEYYDSGDWRGTWQLDGGGALINQGVHTVDLMRWLAGPVESIHAHALTAAHERIDVEDVTVATLKFENGAIGTLTASTACYNGEPARIGIYGTEGTAIIEGDRLKCFRLKDGTDVTAEEASRHAVRVAMGGTASVKDDAQARLAEEASRDPGAVWGDAHREQLRDFIAAIREDRAPLIDAAEGRKALEIVLGVYRSAKTGKIVRLSRPASTMQAAGAEDRPA